MTTHERDKIIAAAKEAGFGAYAYEAMSMFERFYAIAYEDGRQAEREDCSSGWEPHKEYFGSTIVDTIRARSTK